MYPGNARAGSSRSPYPPPPGPPPAPSSANHPFLVAVPPLPANQLPPSPSPQWTPGQRFYVSGSGAPQSVTQYNQQPRNFLPPPPLPQRQTSPSSTRTVSCCCCSSPSPTHVYQCVTCGTINDPFISEFETEEDSNGLSEDDIALLEEELDYSAHGPPPRPDDPHHPESVFISRIRTTFSSIHNLNVSCRSSQEPKVVSMESVSKLYAMIMQRPAAVVALRETVESLLQRPRLPLDLGDGGWILVLFECPLFSPEGTPQADQRSWLVSHLVGLISNLSNSQHSALVDWVSSADYSKSLLEKKVDMITAFISLRLAGSIHSPSGYAADWGIQAGSRVGSLLFAANQKRPRLSMPAFYVTLIDTLGPVAIVKSFDVWESRVPLFSLCQYPFLLSLGVKIHLISHEARRLMEHKLHEALRSMLFQNTVVQPFLVLQVRRTHLVSDALKQISTHTQEELQKSLKVKFEGEEGVDAGGVKKEFFLALCRQLFDPQFGMFSYAGDSTLCWFNPSSQDQEEFFLVGAVLGLAIYNNVTLDVPLPLAVYKKLKDEPVTLSDLAVFDPELARGLEALLSFEGDVANVFCRTFVGEYEAWGEVQQVELVPGGAEKVVDETNRKEFVELLVDFVLSKSIASQFASFSAGFSQVASGNAFSLVKGEEVELLIRGSPEPLDIDQLKAVTSYDGFTGDRDPTVIIFWDVFASMSSKQQRQLLSFITGSDRIPATGTSALQLKLVCLGEDTGRMPTSHTCFDTLCLYRYKSKWTMEDRLVRAMEESEGFGLK